MQSIAIFIVMLSGNFAGYRCALNVVVHGVVRVECCYSDCHGAISNSILKKQNKII